MDKKVEFTKNQAQRRELYYNIIYKVVDEFDFGFGISNGEERKDELSEFVSKLMVVRENQTLSYYSMKQIDFQILPYLKEKCLHHEENNSGTIGEMLDSHITEEELKEIKLHIKTYLIKLEPTEVNLMGKNN